MSVGAVLRTTIVMFWYMRVKNGSGYCSYGTYISARASASGDCSVFPITPTISIQGSVPSYSVPSDILWPIGSDVGKNCRANASFTTTTRGEPSRSFADLAPRATGKGPPGKRGPTWLGRASW